MQKAHYKHHGVRFEVHLSSFYVKEECHSPFLCHFDKAYEVLDVYSKIVDGDTSDKEEDGECMYGHDLTDAEWTNTSP